MCSPVGWGYRSCRMYISRRISVIIVLINFFETILSWPVIHLVVRWGISHFFMATRNTTEGVREKKKRQTNNMGLGQLKVQEE